MEERIESSIRLLWQEARELSFGVPPRIDHLPNPPTPLHFLRCYAAANKPCLISSAVSTWPALSRWTSADYLREALADAAVSVHLTPTGKADALAPLLPSPPSSSSSSLCFASAHVETVPFPEALDMVLASRKGKKVAYLQQQNDCFRSEYGPLAADCEDHVPWATEALGCSPEAVNLWIGTDASETSFHKDHYENLYVVITGEKRFLLLPPTEVHRMYVTDYPTARYLYHKGSGQFSIEVDGSATVPWSSVDPYPEPDEKQRAMERFPLYYNGPNPLQVTVKAGEMLYLPSMWFHHVRQVEDGSGLTIAVNYWYDMQFDSRYAYFNFLQSIPRHEIENKEANLETSRCNGSDDDDDA